MVAELLIDTARLDRSRPVYVKEEIRRRNPQRFEMEMLDGILLHDTEAGLIVGYLEVRRDAWWARGHFPDRPMLPGVLGLEAGGQLCTFYFHHSHPDTRMGLGCIDSVRFRRPIEPPTILYIVAKVLSVRQRFARFQLQGILDGQVAFEAQFTGAAL
jgi:3-hydroxyacyl-[acyl-carrier-protein] dehydratase